MLTLFVCSDHDSPHPIDRFHRFLVQLMMVMPNRNVLVRLSRFVQSFLKKFFCGFSFLKADADVCMSDGHRPF